MSLNTITWQDIATYDALLQRDMMPEEVSLLRAIEHEFTKYRASRMPKKG